MQPGADGGGWQSGSHRMPELNTAARLIEVNIERCTGCMTEFHTGSRYDEMRDCQVRGAGAAGRTLQGQLEAGH